ncbi:MULTISPECIES: hypothetical protein [unclassified Streptomyces]|uniref:hypothetical protein n=1 Tax=unclassified Streptomyces TaxID=2593676 RepID=UPI001BEB53A0|nr:MULTISPECIES: hypothetical protein [unclassified Streptomyces]MBT2405233.1 hypothetical protein [Streptomyces sp. ISL-21]MBT2453357.1 hypothetical protein [Streptomyces sp. ISL-86]MBT2611001.1 hypothetical protein [Streptomyces sp. ISL-87]
MDDQGGAGGVPLEGESEEKRRKPHVDKPADTRHRSRSVPRGSGDAAADGPEGGQGERQPQQQPGRKERRAEGR